MNARSTTIAIAIALHCVIASAAPRLNFTRTVAAPHDLGGARDVAVIYALGDNDKVAVFVEHFVEHANRSGALRVENASDLGRHLLGAQPSDATIAELRREHGADAYLGVTRFTCAATERSAEGSERDSSGERIKRTHHWLDAICSARVDVMSGEGKRLFSFHVNGEGTSPRVAELTSEERNIALEQAAHFAAVSAAEGVTPRVVRESVELDESAPEFDEVYSMIVADRLNDARAIWEAALRRHRNSAALHFDLGAVAEAIGDVDAARKYFAEAQRLSPSDPHYKSEWTMFRRRNAIK